MRAVRVLVVEDDARLRARIAELVRRDALVPHVVGTARAALAALEAFEPDIFLVDLGLPDLDGVELITVLAARRPSTPILVLSAATAEARIRAALAAGARGYILKEDLGNRLLVAVDEALHGGMPMSRAVAEILLAQLRGTHGRCTSVARGPLSVREHEVLLGLARGLTYDETALDLGVSVNTVRSHVRATYEKLHASTRIEALNTAYDQGLLARS